MAYVCLGLVVAYAPPTTTPVYGPGATWKRTHHAAVMMHVPAGEFVMGSADSDTTAAPDEKPAHSVFLDAFWIDRTEVTNRQGVGR